MSKRYWLTAKQLGRISKVVREEDVSLPDLWAVCDLLKQIEHDQHMGEEWQGPLGSQAVVDAVQAWGDVYEDKDVKTVDTMEVVRAMHRVCDALDAYTMGQIDDE